MDRPRSTRWLRAFLALAGCVLLLALAQRCWPVDFDGAVLELTDGDADGEARSGLLARVRDEGLSVAVQRGQARPALWAAASALVLDDETAFSAILDGAREAGLRSRFLPGEAAAGPGGDPDGVDGDADALGVPAVRSLWLGQAAQNAGDATAARRHYERARDSARLAGFALIERLASDRLQALR